MLDDHLKFVTLTKPSLKPLPRACTAVSGLELWDEVNFLLKKRGETRAAREIPRFSRL